MVHRAEEFLNPKSMLTPGVAGSLTMLITNSLWVAFAVPQKWSGLIVSLLFSLVVLRAKALPFWQRAIYWALNGLVIFAVALGANLAGMHVTGTPHTIFLRPPAELHLEAFESPWPPDHRPFFMDWL